MSPSTAAGGSSDEVRGQPSAAKTLSKDVLLRSVLWIGLVLGGGYLLRLTAPFVVPLVFAVFLQILFTPVADFLERLRVPAVVATTLCTAAVLVILGLLGLLVGLSAASVGAEAPEYGDRASALLQDLSRFSREHLSKSLSELGSKASQSLPTVLQNLAQPARQVVQALIGTLFALVFFTFLLHARALVQERVRRIVAGTRSEAPRRERALDDAATTVRQYLWLKTLISVATGLTIGGASVAVGLDFPLVWGLTAFALNYIPSIGAFLAVLPAAMVALLQGGWVFGAVVSALMAAIHFLSGNVIEPLVLGSRLRINFIVVLVSLFAWGLVWGFAGMVLAVPITACIKAALDQSERPTKLELALDEG